MKLIEQFRKEHPETIGEKDNAFDRANYIDWLEHKYDEAIMFIEDFTNSDISELKTIERLDQKANQIINNNNK